MSDLHVVDEYSTLVLRLNDRDVRYIHNLQEKHGHLRLEGRGNGIFSLSVGPMVGHIVLSSAEIRIRPKIPYTSLFYLIARSASYQLDLQRPVEVEPLDVQTLYIFHHLLHLLRNFIPRGMRRRYVEDTGIQQTVRGKLNISHTISLHMRGRTGLVCTTDQFTEDNVLNQIIKYTLVKSVQFVDPVDETLAHRLSSLLRKLRRISYRRISVRTVEDTIQRLQNQTSHYLPVLSLCLLILSGQSVTQHSGDVTYSSFLINMNVLYEHFVFRILSSYLLEYSVIDNLSRRLVSDGGSNKLIFFRPDVTVREQRDVIMVADAKYKYWDHQRNRIPINEDFYQILSYSLFLKSPLGMLFYPNPTPEYQEPIIFKLEKYGVKIWIFSLPLGNQDWDELDARMERILSEVYEIIHNRGTSS